MAFLASGIEIDPEKARRTMRPQSYDLSEHIQPLRDECCVLLDPRDRGFTSELDLVLPDACTHQPTTGQVVAVAKRCTAVSVGDRVVVGKWNGRVLPDAFCARFGFEPESLYIMRPVIPEPGQPVTSDHIYAVLE